MYRGVPAQVGSWYRVTSKGRGLEIVLVGHQESGISLHVGCLPGLLTGISLLGGGGVCQSWGLEMREGGTAEGWVIWKHEREDDQWVGGIPGLLAGCLSDGGLGLAVAWARGIC